MILNHHPSSLTDNDFDALYPEHIQKLSALHWSPISAIKTALDFFSATLSPNAKILDVGSGVGKFCLYGSLISDFNFVGVEKRKHLFNVSNKTTAKMGANNVSYIHDDALNVDWNSFDGIYLFNPFYEYIIANNSGLHIDSQVAFSESKYSYYVDKTYKKLSSLIPGTVVVSLYGFGRTFPKEYIEKYYKKVEGMEISLWEKT